MTDDTSTFECGRTSVDEFFRRYALKNDQLGIANCYVLPRPEEMSGWPEICGLYTLSMNAVNSDLVAKAIHKKLPRYQAPVVLLGQFGTTKAVQRQGAGEFALMDALRRGLCCEVASTGMITDALDEAAVRFYTKYGFAPLDDLPDQYPRRLFFPRGLLTKLGA